MPHRSGNPMRQAEGTHDACFYAAEAGALCGGDEGESELGGGKVVGPARKEGDGEEDEESEGHEGRRLSGEECEDGDERRNLVRLG